MTRTFSLFFVLTLTSLASTRVGQAQLPGTVKPGPEHKSLQKMEGAWDVAITILGGIKTVGEATFKMECGGLWLHSDLRFALGPIKIQTKSTETFDPVKKKYISVQVDSMTTAPSILEGTYDEQGTTLTSTGEARDFNGESEQIKSVTKHVDDDHVVVAVYRVFPDGKERKHLTIEYTRRNEKDAK